jgi:hypothetical protein
LWTQNSRRCELAANPLRRTADHSIRSEFGGKLRVRGEIGGANLHRSER